MRTFPAYFKLQGCIILQRVGMQSVEINQMCQYRLFRGDK